MDTTQIIFLGIGTLIFVVLGLLVSWKFAFILIMFLAILVLILYQILDRINNKQKKLLEKQFLEDKEIMEKEVFEKKYGKGKEELPRREVINNFREIPIPIPSGIIDKIGAGEPIITVPTLIEEPRTIEPNVVSGDGISKRKPGRPKGTGRKHQDSNQQVS